MMTIADRKAIGDHVRARESSGEFRTALEAAYAVIRDIEEYQQMAAILLHQLKIEATPDAANLVLTALSCGFAFGEDYGQSRFADGLVIGTGGAA
jgi:hypothetical protein